jgi:hypothetical protein
MGLEEWASEDLRRKGHQKLSVRRLYKFALTDDVGTPYFQRGLSHDGGSNEMSFSSAELRGIRHAAIGDRLEAAWLIQSAWDFVQVRSLPLLGLTSQKVSYTSVIARGERVAPSGHGVDSRRWRQCGSWLFLRQWRQP